MSQYARDEYWYHSGRELSNDKPDVFYVVSTVLLASYDADGNESKLACLNSDDKQAMDGEISDVATNMFTGEFNLFAPYYHQVTMNTGLNCTDEERKSYFAAAQAEVNEAFDFYFDNLNGGRPFVLAGFSQGAVLAKGLLSHLSDAQMESMAAAYIMGGPISESDLRSGRIAPAKARDDLGVAVSFNSVASVDACWSAISRNNVSCINPINWTTDETPATFTYNGKEVTVRVDKAHHVLVVDGFDPRDYYLPNWPFPLGNYHNEEIHFYARSIRQNALLRLAKLRERR